MGAAQRQPLGRVDGSHRLDRDTAYLGPAPLFELLGLEAGPPDERPGTGGRDDPRNVAKQAQRGQVEVVVMQVRDEHRVDAVGHAGPRAMAAQMGDPGAKHRVGQEAHAGVLEKDGGVAEIGDSRRRYEHRIVSPDGATSHHPTWVIPSHPRGPQNRAMRGRRIGVGALLVIATLLWTALGFAVWANRQALNTDNWTDTSTALLEDDEIRTTVGLFIIDRLYQSDAVEQRLAEVLPPRLVQLAKPAAAGLKEVAQRNAGRVLGTDAALQAWETANRTAHQGLIRIVESDVASGEVSLQLGSLFEQMATATGLPPEAVEKLPPNVSELQIASGDKLQTAQDMLDLFKTILWVLLVLSVGAFAGAIALSRDRRRTVIKVGGCLMFAGVALFAVRTIGGSVVTDALADAPNAHAVADDVWAIATSLLVDAAEGSFLFGLFLAVGAWLAGEGRRATATRRIFAYSLRERPGLVRAGLGVAILLLIIWGPVPWTQRLWGIAIFTVLAFLWLELIRRRTLEEFPNEPAPQLSVHLPWRTGGRASELERLAVLRERGVLSQAEFDREKAALLAGGREPAEA
jgi:Short C-terminal domain